MVRHYKAKNAKKWNSSTYPSWPFFFPYRTRYLDRYAKRLANASLLLRRVRDAGPQLVEAHDSILGLHIPPDLEVLSSWHLLSLDLDACHHTLIERSQHTCHWKKKLTCLCLLGNGGYKRRRAFNYATGICHLPAEWQGVPHAGLSLKFCWNDWIGFSTACTSHLSQTSMTSVGNALQLIKVSENVSTTVKYTPSLMHGTCWRVFW